MGLWTHAGLKKSKTIRRQYALVAYIGIQQGKMYNSRYPQSVHVAYLADGLEKIKWLGDDEDFVHFFIFAETIHTNIEEPYYIQIN